MSDNILRTSFNGDSNLGLYGFATDKYCLVGVHSKRLQATLDVPVYHIPLLNMDLSGIFVCGNSHGIMIPEIVEEYNMPHLRKHFDNILVLRSKYSALGNLIMMNDNGIVLSPLLKKERKKIEKFFKLPCAVSMIARQRVVGNLGIATNKGCLLHPKVKKDEMKIIEETLGVKCDIGTVNFGSPYPGAGIITNSSGFAAGEASSGPELGRINEALGFI